MSTTTESTLTIEQAQASTAESVVNTETPLGWVDIAVAAALVAAAVYYLYRSLWRKRGQCSGCSNQGKQGCTVKKVDPPKP